MQKNPEYQGNYMQKTTDCKNHKSTFWGQPPLMKEIVF